MSLDYIRRTYGVPAKRGQRVQYLASDGELVEGRITGSSGGRLRVRLDGNKQSFIFHPTFNLAYRRKGKWVDADKRESD
jgi:hypothetical protein